MPTKIEIKKVLLIMPPATISKEYTKEIQPPLGLAYIAACLPVAGCNQKTTAALNCDRKIRRLAS